MPDRRYPEDIPDFDPYNPGDHVHGDVRASMPTYGTAFEDLIADNTTNRIDIPGTYDYNVGRHRFLENGTFIQDPDAELTDPNALTDLEGKFQVTATADDEHIFGAREKLRYVPNYELLWGCAAWAESDLSTGQHFAVEFSNQAGDNGYRYHYEGTAEGYDLTLEQFQGSTTPVDSVAADTDDLDGLGFDPTQPSIARDKLNWYGGGLSEFELSFPVFDQDGTDIAEQFNVTAGRTANRDDVATDEINLNVQVRVWCDTGAADLTVNICSLGALIRGNATEVDREKPAIFYPPTGNISQYPTDNVSDALAARIDPNRREVAVKLEPPIFQPSGTGVLMEMGVYAVHKDNSSLTVNFDDPDDDGVDEGPSPASQARGSSDVIQYTSDVTSIPTTTDIRADFTTGLVPDMRHLTTTVGQSGGGATAGTTSAGELSGIKRIIFPDDVIIFLPRTDPNGSTSSGRIRYLKTLFEQDW